jgi:hypothetical protein
MTPAEKFAAGLCLIAEACEEMESKPPTRLMFKSGWFRNIVEMKLAADPLATRHLIVDKRDVTFMGVKFGIDW